MKLLLSGLDTIECAYYLRAGADCKLDFAALRAQREIMRQSQHPESGVLGLGGMEFMLSPNGTKSGYACQYLPSLIDRYSWQWKKSALLAAAQKEKGTAGVPNSVPNWLANLGLEPETRDDGAKNDFEDTIQPATTGPPVKNQLSFQKAALHHGQESLLCGCS